VATERVDNVLFLPTAAVSSRGTTATVNVAPNKNNLKSTVPKEVTLGLRGDTGIQILTGLNEGDVVVVTRNAVSTAQSTQSNSNTASNPLTGSGSVTGNGFTGAGAGAGGNRTATGRAGN
jgi:hypothetical protein